MALTAPTADLTGNTIADTYDQLLILDNAAGIVENTLKIVSTQLGRSALQLDDEKVLIKGVDTSNALAFEVQEGADATSYIAIGTGATTKGVTINESGQTDINFRVESSGEPYAFFVHGGNGRVGIGISSPSIETDAATASSNLLQIHDTTTGSATTGGGLVLSHDDGAVQADTHRLGFISFSGAEDTSNNLREGARIEALAAQAWSTSGHGTELHFYTEVVGGQEPPAKRMVISDSGKVGIGTDSPASPLTIFGGDGYSDGIYFNRTGNLGFGISNNVLDSTESLRFSYTAADFGSSNTPIMVLKQSGYVGIGIDAPGDNLHVYKTSGSVGTKVQSPSLASTEEAYQIIAGTKDGGSIRYAKMGVYYQDQSSAGGTNEAAAYVRLSPGEGGEHFMWFDNAEHFRVGDNINEVGSTGGTDTGHDTSDERLKNISDDPFSYGLDTVNSLTPIEYTWKKHPELGNRLGFGAQTMQPIVPEMVFQTGSCIDGYDRDEETGETTPKSDDKKFVMDYKQMHAILVKAIQELSAKVTALENA